MRHLFHVTVVYCNASVKIGLPGYKLSFNESKEYLFGDMATLTGMTTTTGLITGVSVSRLGNRKSTASSCTVGTSQTPDMVPMFSEVKRN